MPATIEQIDDRVGDARHFGLALAQALDRLVDVGGEAPAILSLKWSTVSVRSLRSCGRMCASQCASSTWRLPAVLACRSASMQRFIADAVQFSGYGFETDVGHGVTVGCEFGGRFGSPSGSVVVVRRDGSARRSATVSPSDQFGAANCETQPRPPQPHGGVTLPAGKSRFPLPTRSRRQQEEGT